MAGPKQHITLAAEDGPTTCPHGGRTGRVYGLTIKKVADMLRRGEIERSDLCTHCVERVRKEGA